MHELPGSANTREGREARYDWLRTELSERASANAWLAT
jgi:hypothetical protein